MMAEGPAVVAGHAFTTGKIAQTGFETPLRSSREKVGVVNGFGCFPEKVLSAKNTGSFILDDFEQRDRNELRRQRQGTGRADILQSSRRDQYNQAGGVGGRHRNVAAHGCGASLAPHRKIPPGIAGA
jgi:hypothetical protein